MGLTAKRIRHEIDGPPADWDAPSIGDLFTFKNGVNKAKRFFGYGTPIVNYMDVFKNRGLTANQLKGRVDADKNELKAFEVRKGDVFFTRTSETVEDIGITSVMLDEPVDTIFSGFVLRARPTDDSLNDQFKQYCFSTNDVRKQITSKSTYTTRALTNGRLLSAVKILRPSKPEQKAIAAALDDLVGLISSLDALVAKKRDIKLATIQQLLSGRRRLAEFDTNCGFKETELGLIPADWTVKKLSEICFMKSGQGITNADIDQMSPYPCYGGNGLRGFTARFTHDGCHSLIGRQGALCGNVLRVKGKFFASEHAIVVTACPQTDIDWLTFVLERMKLNQYSESSAQPGLSVSKILNLAVARPSAKAEQESIAAVLSDIDAEIAALEARARKILDIKKSTAEELLSGRIRLE